ncbi:MAG: YkgJ family cysteine cluster protein [Breznakibacter sp.]
MEFLKSFSIDGLDGLKQIYIEYDTLFKSVHNDTGFGCIEGCGACCHTPGHKIEVTIFEMVPLALELVLQGKAEETYDLLDNMDTEHSVCIHYKMLSDDGKKGFCTIHPHRPLICRLFAGGSRIDRDDKRELVLCKPLKEKYKNSSMLLANVADRLPIITEFASRARELNPTFTQKMVPINEGLKLALGMVLTYWHFHSLSEQR